MTVRRKRGGGTWQYSTQMPFATVDMHQSLGRLGSDARQAQTVGSYKKGIVVEATVVDGGLRGLRRGRWRIGSDGQQMAST